VEMPMLKEASYADLLWTCVFVHVYIYIAAIYVCMCSSSSRSSSSSSSIFYSLLVACE
jgi:hypothetical protein